MITKKDRDNKTPRGIIHSMPIVILLNLLFTIVRASPAGARKRRPKIRFRGGPVNFRGRFCTATPAGARKRSPDTPLRRARPQRRRPPPLLLAHPRRRRPPPLLRARPRRRRQPSLLRARPRRRRPASLAAPDQDHLPPAPASTEQRMDGSINRGGASSTISPTRLGRAPLPRSISGDGRSAAAPTRPPADHTSSAGEGDDEHGEADDHERPLQDRRAVSARESFSLVLRSYSCSVSG
jgi:hypothetical protein